MMLPKSSEVLGWNNTSAQRQRLASTVMMFPSGNLTGLRQEQHFRTTEAFSAVSDDLTVWELTAVGATH